MSLSPAYIGRSPHQKCHRRLNLTRSARVRVCVHQCCDPKRAIIERTEWCGPDLTVAAVPRVAEPAAAAAYSLFTFSATNNISSGNFVYVVLIILVCIGLYVAVKLPRHAWSRHA